MGSVPIPAIEDADSRGVIFLGEGAEEANESDFVVDLESFESVPGKLGDQWIRLTLSSGRDAILK